MAALDIEVLGQLHDQLKSIKQGIVDTYASKTGLSVDKLSRMMKDETWMSAQEAVDYGFANEVISGGQAQNASKTAFVNALQSYVNVPRALLESSSQSDAVNDERALQAKRLAAHAKLYLTKE
jgi:ATP-dependent Clp protease protease subunit